MHLQASSDHTKNDVQQNAVGHFIEAQDLLHRALFGQADEAINKYKQLISYPDIPRTDNRRIESPEVSVVIVAYNTKNDLIKCVDSVFPQLNNKAELIIVDNGGNDEVIPRLLEYPALYIKCPVNFILSEGRNIGAYFAKGRILAFLDDDAVADKNWIAGIINSFARHNIIGLRGRILPKNKEAFIKHKPHYDLGDKIRPIRFIDTEGNSAFLKEHFIAIGGMNALLFGMEGFELSYRLSKKNGQWKLLYTPDVVIFHDYASNEEKSDIKSKRHAIMNDYLRYKYKDIESFKNPNPVGAKPETGDDSAPAISVCIPTYNRAGYIKEAVLSALNQTYPPFEIVIVDDGSTDDTEDVVKTIRSDRIRYIKKEHSGGPQARNRAIAEAGGEFILWLDSDDVLLPNTLDLYRSMVQKVPVADVYYGNLQVTDENLAPGQDLKYEDWYNRNNELVAALFMSNCVPNPGTLVRRSCYERFGLYDNAFKRAHDYAFWCQISQNAVFKHIGSTVCKWRWHKSNMSSGSVDIDFSYDARIARNMLERHTIRELFPGLDWADEKQCLITAFMLIGNLFLTRNDFKSAIEYYAKSLAVGKTDTGFNNLGVAYLKMQRYAEAKTAFEAALRLNSENQDAKRHLNLLGNSFTATMLSKKQTNRVVVPARVPGSSSINILLLVHNLPSKNLAGTEIYAYELGRELNRRGHGVVILCPHNDPSRPAGEVIEERLDGLVIARLNVPPMDFIGFFRNEAIAGFIDKYIERLSIDLVHVQHLYGFSATPLSVFSTRGIPVIMTLHDGWLLCEQFHFMLPDGSFCSEGPTSVDKCVQCYIKRAGNPALADKLPEVFYLFALRRQYLQNSLSWINTIISPSRYMAERLERHGYNHPRVVVSPIGLKPLPVLPKTASSGTLRFCYLGNIVPTKGLDIAITAFNSVPSESARLDIHGRITDEPYFRKCIASVAAGRAVRYNGPYTHENLPEILAETDVAVISSRAENYPGVIRECLQGCAPVIAPRLGGIPDIITDGMNGLLYKPGESADLAEKMRFFIAHTEKAAEFTSNIKPVLTIPDEAEHLEKIYFGCLNRPVEVIKKHGARSGAVKEETASPVPVGKSGVVKRICSIIMPVYNGVESTRQCLEALVENTPDDLYEIIIIDNASNDGTGDFLATLEGDIKVIRNTENLGFTRACNQGAQAASGEFLIFLHNDTIPHANWLTELVDVADAWKDVGIVGSKLLCPDNTIQHAGIAVHPIQAIMYADRPSNFMPASKPRDLNAVAAAGMLIRRELFFAVGCFNEGYINRYEDIDLCLSVRATGKRVFYNPRSILTHLKEHGSVTEDKMDDGRKLLFERWRDRMPSDYEQYLLEDGFRASNPDKTKQEYSEDLCRPVISIIIVTYNSLNDIGRCLLSIKAYTDIPYEVIVIDNNSADGTKDYLKSIKEHHIILNNKNIGFAKACNQGIKNAKGEYIVLLNPDTEVTTGWAWRMMLHFRDGVGAVGPVSNYVAGLQKYELYRKTDLGKADNNGISDSLYAWNKNRSVETKLLIGFCMMIRRSVMDDIGMLDEDFFLGIEDLEYSWRLRQKGCKLVVATDVFIYHQGQKSFSTVLPEKNRRITQECQDKLYDKLEAFYGKGKVPSSRELWGMDWFKPSQITKSKLTSIVILCFNQLEYTKKCLQSIVKHTSVPYELIIIDNGSSDGTQSFLEEYAKKHSRCSIILNKENRGFAGGNNQGIAAAKGDYILLLNNDVVVTEAWLERLIAHAESDANIGMAGPVSNSISGPQQVENVTYGRNLNKMHKFAQEYSKNNVGRTQDILRLVGFCLLIKRQVLEIIGGMDESYGNGNYEDDDLCLRSRIAGYRHIIAHDVFVHHYGSVTFKGNRIDYHASLEGNLRRFAEKWKDIIEVDGRFYRVSMTKDNQLKKLLEWGENSLARGDVLAAVKTFERIISLDRTNSQALNNLGVIQWQIGRADEAIKTFQNALALNPKDMDALENLADAATETGRFDLINTGTLEKLKQAQPANPDLMRLTNET